MGNLTSTQASCKIDKGEIDHDHKNKNDDDAYLQEVTSRPDFHPGKLQD